MCMHIQVRVGLGPVHCLYCGARKECIVSCVHRSFHELFHGQQAHLGFVTVTDTQQVALQGVQCHDSLWATWEVERRRHPLLPFLLIGCSSAAWLSRCHNCFHNLVVRLRGRPGDVNASDYMRKTFVDWYLIGHSLSCCSERTPTPWEAAAERVT